MTKLRAFWDAVLVVVIPSVAIWAAVAVWLGRSVPEDVHFVLHVAALGCLGTLTLLLPIALLIYRNNIRAQRDVYSIVGTATFVAINMLGILIAFERQEQHRTRWEGLRSAAAVVLTCITLHRLWTEWQAHRAHRR